NRSQAIRRINLALRAPEVGRQGHPGAFLERIGERGQHGANARIVRHLSRFAKWDVKIHPDKQALASYSNVTQSSLGHQSTPLAAMTLRNLLASIREVVHQNIVADILGRRKEGTTTVDFGELVDETLHVVVLAEHERIDGNVLTRTALHLFQRLHQGALGGGIFETN